MVEVDTGWGPYLACNPTYLNPNGTSWDVSRYICSQECVVPPFCPHNLTNGSTGGDGQVTCFCPRSNRTVGVDSFGTPLSPSSASSGTGNDHGMSGQMASVDEAALRDVIALARDSMAVPHRKDVKQKVIANRASHGRPLHTPTAAVPAVCRYGTTFLSNGLCLGGSNGSDVTHGTNLTIVAARCCAACKAPLCSGWSITSGPSGCVKK
jgi:hypothetical protein